MNILPNGIWECDTLEKHTFDEGLAAEIVRFCREEGVDTASDLGCGSGKYVTRLNEAGIQALGYDGNPNTPEFSPCCHVKDLSKPINIPATALVMSLEVGEHIPAEFEDAFFMNVANNAGRFVILSWFPVPGHGEGHVNERSNSYVQDMMSSLGFDFMPEATGLMRQASTKWWFGISLMAFRRRK